MQATKQSHNNNTGRSFQRLSLTSVGRGPGSNMAPTPAWVDLIVDAVVPTYSTAAIEPDEPPQQFLLGNRCVCADGQFALQILLHCTWQSSQISTSWVTRPSVLLHATAGPSRRYADYALCLVSAILLPILRSLLRDFIFQVRIQAC